MSASNKPVPQTDESQGAPASSQARKGKANEDENKFWTHGKSMGARMAFITFIISHGLPANQRWIFFAFAVNSDPSFEFKTYPMSCVLVAVLWYWPWFTATSAYALVVIFDQFRRYRFTRSGYEKHVFSLVTFGFTSILLLIFTDISDFTPLLEPVLGLSDTWISAIWPVLPCLIVAHNQDGSVNGFVPEGKGGIWMGIAAKFGSMVVPFAAQWQIWLAFTVPDIASGNVPWILEWLFCYFVWFWSEVEPRVAYAIYLLIYQYPHAAFARRHRGGPPPDILLKQRRGTLWYIATIFFIEVFARDIDHPMTSKIYSISIPATYWIPAMELAMVAALLIA